jgi:hypothetical protein
MGIYPPDMAIAEKYGFSEASDLEKGIQLIEH